MEISSIKSKLQKIIPFEASSLVLEEIAYSSSYIPFYGKGEYLFRDGDSALGFYWILKGEVEILVDGKKPIILKAGDVAGLDSFLEDTPLSFDIITRSNSCECLFIDRRCYTKIREHHEFNRHMNLMVMNCLRNYRSLLLPAEKVFS